MALAIGNGLDRLAVGNPGTARQVPQLFAINALDTLGQAQLGRDPRVALALAAKLVARAPIEPASTALLGAARRSSGDAPGAERAFRVAGQLGWRDLRTQAYWLLAALDSGDSQVAAQRLDALLRQKPELLRIADMLDPFERDDAGRAALAERLATRPPWLGFYTGEREPVPAPVLVRRVPSLVMLAAQGVVLGCAAIAPAVRQLAAAGLWREAAALRQRHCPAPG